MNLNEALSRIHAPQGMTSLLSAVMSGDFDPIAHKGAVGATLTTARERLAAVSDAQSKATSDWSWWGYEGEIAYWRAVVDVLEAAALVGADALPDVPAPRTDGVLMDVCSYVEAFGRKVLHEAKRQHAADSLAIVD